MTDAPALDLRDAPAGRPMPLAFHDGLLWVGCWDSKRLYALDRATWSVRDEIALPGTPYGLASHDGALRVVVGVGEDDGDRYLYRVVPGAGFDEADRIACPELTGSHLASDGASLYLAQQSLRKLVVLDPAGGVRAEVPLPARCGGIAFDAIAFHFISADEEFDALELATLDLAVPGARPAAIVPLDPGARGLAFDGAAWWTCLREAGTIGSFRTVA